MAERRLSTAEKALALNLDRAKYGTIAEIGGGQEVARWLFHVGGAAGTVAKTISAYDMVVSDTLYGPTPRYVSRERLAAMLEREFDVLAQTLGPDRGAATSFFAFADTVATRSFKHQADGRGWVGVRFQHRPQSPPSEIIIHVTLRDRTAVAQQEALGIVGISLIHGAVFRHDAPPGLIGGLMDELSRDRIDVDMIKLSGPAFAGVDNRLMSLQLVEQGLADAAMFTAAGEVVQAAEVLYRKPVVIERGSFRPVTRLTLDLIERARDRFVREPAVAGKEPLLLMEMTLRNLVSPAGIDHADFLARADILGALGLNVLISRFEQYYSVAEYLTRFTDQMIGIAIGMPSLDEIAQDKYYANLSGGLLEATGRLFKRSVKLYVYPSRDPATGQVVTVHGGAVPPLWRHLRDLLLETGHLEAVDDFDPACLDCSPAEVLARLRRGDRSWEAMVPAPVAEAIRSRGLFGYVAPVGEGPSGGT
jgi:hypothetical protein